MVHPFLFKGDTMKTTILAISTLISIAFSASHHLAPDQSIARSIVSARPGDTLFLAAGTYNESFALEDGITLIGESAQSTIISGSGRDNCIIMSGSASIAQVTVTGGTNGIQTQSARAKISDVIITENRGSGILVLNRMPLIQNCIISNNAGNGIYGTDIGGGELILDNLTIAQNQRYGIQVTGTEPILVTNSVIYRNGIRAFKDENTRIVATNNSIYPVQDAYELNNLSHKPLFNRDREVRSLFQLSDESPIKLIGAQIQ